MVPFGPQRITHRRPSLGTWRVLRLIHPSKSIICCLRASVERHKGASSHTGWPSAKFSEPFKKSVASAPHRRKLQHVLYKLLAIVPVRAIRSLGSLNVLHPCGWFVRETLITCFPMVPLKQNPRKARRRKNYFACKISMFCAYPPKWSCRSVRRP